MTDLEKNPRPMPPAPPPNKALAGMAVIAAAVVGVATFTGGQEGTRVKNAKGVLYCEAGGLVARRKAEAKLCLTGIAA